MSGHSASVCCGDWRIHIIYNNYVEGDICLPKTERDHSVMALSIFACSVYSQAHAVPQRTADQKIKIFEKISPQNSIFSDTTA